MHKITFAFFILGLCSACSSEKTSGVMYFSETQLKGCETVTSQPNEGVPIGDLFYTLYPDSGLLCVKAAEGNLVNAYEPSPRGQATHQWLFGTSDSFERRDPDEVGD